MTPRQREPITDAERDSIRQRRREGASLEEIAAEFRCSPITARKICSNVLPRTYEIGKPINQDKIDKIIELRMQGRAQPDIARMVGVSLNVVTKYTPPELKIARPRGEQGRKRVRWAPEIINGINPGGIRWTPEEDKRLFAMLQEQCSLREIADKLNRTYVSVKDKVGRLSRYGEHPRKEGAPQPAPEKKAPPRAAPITVTRVKCLKCLSTFESYDPRRNRICGRCKSNEDWK